MDEVVLLGDSIFDNALYIGGGPDVSQQVGERLPMGWKATLLAIDGSVTSDVQEQLPRLPKGHICNVYNPQMKNGMPLAPVNQSERRSPDHVAVIKA